MSTVAATRQAPLDRVICSACRRNYTPNEFYLTACPHILCSTCLFPPPTLAPSTLPLDAQATCPACHEATSILKLEFDSPALNPNANEQIIALRHCFRPLGELVEELGMAAEFQTAGLLEQVDYLTEKVARQRNVLDKVQVELRAHKQLKLKYEETRAENDQLRLQLQERNNMVSQLQQGSYHPFAQESRKRKPLGSPPSQDFPRRAPSNVSRSNSRTASHQNFPPPPVQSTSRLTLSPRLVHAHEARELQANLAREEGGAGFRGMVVPSPARLVRGPTPLSARERIAEFAYDPKRTSRIASPANSEFYEPLPPPHQPPSRSDHRQPHTSHSHDDPPHPQALRNEQQQSFNYAPGPSYSHSNHALPTTQSRVEEGEFGNGERTRQRMPFVPPSSRWDGSGERRGITSMPTPLRQSVSSHMPPPAFPQERSRQRQSFPPTPHRASSNPRSASVNSHHPSRQSQQQQQYQHQQPRGSAGGFRPASTTGVRGSFNPFVGR